MTLWTIGKSRKRQCWKVRRQGSHGYEEMIRKMEERKEWKNTATEEDKGKYNQLNSKLRREPNKAREEWGKEKYEELEDREGRSYIYLCVCVHIYSRFAFVKASLRSLTLKYLLQQRAREMFFSTSSQPR